MAPPGTEFETLKELLKKISAKWWIAKRWIAKQHQLHSPNGSPLTTLTSKDNSCRALNPFAERDAADTISTSRVSLHVTSEPTVISPLDEQQQYIDDREEGPKYRSKTIVRFHEQRKYVLSLCLWKIA